MSGPTLRPNSFLAIKGLMIEPTFRAFQHWNLDASTADNAAMIRRTNPIGAPSAGWLENFGKVLRGRFETEGPDRPLVELVQLGWDLDSWRPIFLWHACRTDVLLADFLGNWLFGLREKGIVLVNTEAATEYVRGYVSNLALEKPWGDVSLARAASGLLATAVKLHLLRGHVAKQFEPYRLPERSFFYLLHALMAKYPSTDRMLHAPDWRLFLLRTSDVEDELLRLHQFGKLRFERAGSMTELSLPHRTLNEYLRSAAS